MFAETILFMNGDDDYVRAWRIIFSENGSTVTLYGNGRSTFFGGHLISRHYSIAFLDLLPPPKIIMSKIIGLNSRKGETNDDGYI